MGVALTDGGSRLFGGLPRRRPHGLGIVHLVLSPAKLFLTRRADGSGRIKVLDFAISTRLQCSVSGDSGTISTTGLMGLTGYMSPEQLRSF